MLAILGTFAGAFAAFGAIMALMALGVMAGRKPISGSCGGLSPNGRCNLCGKGMEDRPEDGVCPEAPQAG